MKFIMLDGILNFSNLLKIQEIKENLSHLSYLCPFKYLDDLVS